MNAEFLKFVAESLTQNNSRDRLNAWHLLTALRGPDFIVRYEHIRVSHEGSIFNGDDTSSGSSAMNDSIIKQATTAVIRYAVVKQQIPIMGSNVFDLGWTINPDGPDKVSIRQWLAAEGRKLFPTHFLDHAMYAFIALGLEWNKLNNI